MRTRAAQQLQGEAHVPISHHLLLVFPTELDVTAAVVLASNFPQLRLLACCRSPQDAVGEVLSCVDDRDSGPALAVLGTGQKQFILHLGFALLLGRRRRSVTQFATLMGSTARTLQGATQRKCLPSPHRLLLWGQAFWSL